MTAQIIKEGQKYLVYHNGELIAERYHYFSANMELLKALKEK